MTPLILFLSLVSRVSSHTPYGSKAPYHLIAGDIREFEFPCKPTALYSLHRHGTRNIGEKHVKKIDVLLRALKSHYVKNGLPNADLGWILDFEHGHSPDKELVEEGYLELLGQGQRFREAFPHLFSSSTSSPYSVKVGTTSKGRCASSALSYLFGVYQTNYHILNESRVLSKDDVGRHCGGMCHVYTPLTHPDPSSPSLSFHHDQDNLLRYYSACKLYKEKVGNKEQWQGGSQRYLMGKKMRVLTRTLSERLGIELSPHDTVTLHILCSLEVVLPRLMPRSQFCALFRDDELYITAYYQDLLRYAGKLMEEAVNSSCILLQDALAFLSKGSGASLKFAHTETIFPLLEHIGYLTEPMRGHNLSLTDRQFFGDITPFASNFVLVAMKCPGSADTPLQAFLNEKPIELSRCGSYCTVEKLREAFPSSGCDFAAICEPSLIDSSSLIGIGIAVIVLGELLRRRIII